MKKLFCVIFLFGFYSEAVTTVKAPCKLVFEDKIDGSQSSKASSIDFINKAVQNNPASTMKQSPQQLLHFIPYTISDSNKKNRLAPIWKSQVLKNLAQFDPPLLLSLFYRLARLSDHLDLEHERPFFRSLKKASAKHLKGLNKRQLVDIIWALVQLELESPEKEFVQAWRESAFEKRSEFTAVDRYGLHGFFKKLKITALEF